ncbi:putative HTH-type transcriptional regulator Rv2887 [Deinococcus xinjiangensis]|uniref:HTH-type transcriptional regulator Rv2887 n=1 Tax=Deinococcus xinjiangensis TaxID=457454 RepID=A0ABP9VCG8_9DEIO
MQERLGLVIKRAERAMMSAKEQALRPLDLTVPQFAALSNLAQHPGANGAELARQSLVTPQNMTTILSNLESKGYIARTPHPYHRKMLETKLTPEGLEVLRRGEQSTLEVEQRFAKGLTAQQREQLSQALEFMIQNLYD